MQVIALRKIGKYQKGDIMDIPTKAARALMKAKKVGEVGSVDAQTAPEPAVSAPTYETRMLTAETPVTAAPAKRAYVRRTPPKTDTKED